MKCCVSYMYELVQPARGAKLVSPPKFPGKSPEFARKSPTFSTRECTRSSREHRFLSNKIKQNRCSILCETGIWRVDDVFLMCGHASAIKATGNAVVSQKRIF